MADDNQSVEPRKRIKNMFKNIPKDKFDAAFKYAQEMYDIKKKLNRM
jgi:hypothetical protein